MLQLVQVTAEVFSAEALVSVAFNRPTVFEDKEDIEQVFEDVLIQTVGLTGEVDITIVRTQEGVSESG